MSYFWDKWNGKYSPDDLKFLTTYTLDACLAMKDSRSAAGYDGMTNGILKGCNEDMKKLFLKVINY
jgi:hypothetical protein